MVILLFGIEEDEKVGIYIGKRNKLEVVINNNNNNMGLLAY